MDWHHNPIKVLYTGKSGSGKTTAWLERIAREHCDYLFVFDGIAMPEPGGEYAHRTGTDYVCDWQAAAWCLKQRKPVIFDPGELFPGNRSEGFERFCDFTLSMAEVLPGRKILAVDEVQKFARKSPANLPHSFQVILDEGRKYNLDLVLISRRPNQVNEAIRAELTELCVFQHTDRNPLAWLEEDGFDPEEVRALAFPGGCITRTL